MKFTKYEKARIIGARALQIAMGAPILVKMEEKDFKKMNFDSVKIARKEFEDGILPITIKRPLPEKINN